LEDVAVKLDVGNQKVLAAKLVKPRIEWAAIQLLKIKAPPFNSQSKRLEVFEL
jgi:hypothetical protein